MMKKKTTRKTSKPLSTGQVNQLIDNLVHPFFEEDKNLIWFDGLLHLLNEMDPEVSIEKFIKYNVPLLLKPKKIGKKPKGKVVRP